MKESALNSRNSSIELLKIIAIVGIVVSHVVQTLLIPEGGVMRLGVWTILLLLWILSFGLLYFSALSVLLGIRSLS